MVTLQKSIEPSPEKPKKEKEGLFASLDEIKNQFAPREKLQKFARELLAKNVYANMAEARSKDIVEENEDLIRRGILLQEQLALGEFEQEIRNTV